MSESFKEFVTEARLSQKAEIERYTDLSRDLSRSLYNHHMAGTTPPEHFEGHSLSMLDTITKKSKLAKNTIVHTGVRHDPSTLTDEHGHLHLAAYTSTSDDYDQAHKFAVKQARRNDDNINKTKKIGHVISISLKKGQHAVSIESKSTYKDEQERLLPRNTKLKINPTPNISTDADGRVIHNWSAHVVSQGEP